jgi:hypothetical protein
MSDLRREIEEIIHYSSGKYPLDYENIHPLATAIETLFEKRIRAERFDAYDKCQLDAEKRIEPLRKALQSKSFDQESDGEEWCSICGKNPHDIECEYGQAIKQVVEGEK